MHLLFSSFLVADLPRKVPEKARFVASKSQNNDFVDRRAGSTWLSADLAANGWLLLLWSRYQKILFYPKTLLLLKKYLLFLKKLNFVFA